MSSHRFWPWISALLLIVTWTTFCVVGCVPSSRQLSNSTDSSSAKNTSTSPTVKLEFPEGDSSVPAELGGPGFTGDGWMTHVSGPIGDPRAVKGGVILSSFPSWPDNLRMYGIRSNTWLNSLIRRLCHESLLSIHPGTLEFIPGLASHWKISDDKMTFTFRINPKAHWSDGKAVTAEDFIATYRLIADDTLLAPMVKESIVSNMDEPVPVSKYIVEVTCKEKDWRNFIAISGMTVLPAHEIANLTGEAYLEQYNFKYTAGTGPYVVHPKDIKTDESITLSRRRDYWAADEPAHQGLYNFEKIRFVVIRDSRLAFDKACKGELDLYLVNTAKWWVEDLSELAAVDHGYLVRRKVYTKFPRGIQGQAVNTRVSPLNDVGVRKAMAHLFDRKTMLEKFAYNEYEPLKSYFPGSDAQNFDNVLVEYDLSKAAALLADAGWTERGGDGILVRSGERLTVTLTYASDGLEKYFTVYQEACKQVGVELKLQLLDPATHWNNLQDRKFQFAGMAWGASLFPHPRSNWHSSMADRIGSNNFIGFNNLEADQLIEQYDKEFDLAKRNELLRQLDAVIFNEHAYILDWYLPCERFIYWNKFGMPDTVLLKYHEWEDAFVLWWSDSEKREVLKQAQRQGTRLSVPPIEVKPWSGKEQVASANH
ncbi:MAG: hypothetical protein CMJ81_10655 [Planctomycetaceae bacterium]|nr:hypothetical protein [Planctomycetaceae bacterium]MBP63829.1 hypothetical protein [Planctomycetaceae bacterium]